LFVFFPAGSDARVTDYWSIGAWGSRPSTVAHHPAMAVFQYCETPLWTSTGLDFVRQSRAENTKKEIPGIEPKARTQNHFPLA
jgi:hypothetical protein